MVADTNVQIIIFRFLKFVMFFLGGGLLEWYAGEGVLKYILIIITF